MLDKSDVVINNNRYLRRRVKGLLRIAEDSKMSTTRWRKAAIQGWLTEKGIDSKKKGLKPILLQKCELVRIIKK